MSWLNLGVIFLLLVQVVFGVLECTRWNNRPLIWAITLDVAWVLVLTFGGAWK